MGPPEEQAGRIVKDWLQDSDTVVRQSMQHQLRCLIEEGIRAAKSAAVAEERERLALLLLAESTKAWSELYTGAIQEPGALYIGQYMLTRIAAFIRASGGNGGAGEGEGK